MSARLLSFLMMGLLLSPAPARAEEDLWPSLRSQVFGDEAVIKEETGVVRLEAPVRAEDAALTPITISLAPETAAKVKKVTLIIEKNPAPVAATFFYGPAAGSQERHLTTRVRVDQYSFVRAVAEMEDGQLHMASKFVKASGGCSAPASKDAEAALIGLGKIRITTKAGNGGAEATVMIKHPNFSGLQMDDATRAFTPSRFVNEMEVRRGGELVLKMEGGISISENPHFQFNFDPGQNAALEVSAKETGGLAFSATHQQNGS